MSEAESDIYYPENNLKAVLGGRSLDDFKPRFGHALIRWLGRRETKGGVILPQNRQRAGMCKGILLRLGPVGDDESELREGQTIIFDLNCDKEFVGPQIPGNEDPVFVMRVEDIMAIDERKEKVA